MSTGQFLSSRSSAFSSQLVFGFLFSGRASSALLAVTGWLSNSSDIPSFSDIPCSSDSDLSRSSCVLNTFTVMISFFVDWSAKVILIVAIFSPSVVVSAGVSTLIVACSGRFLKAFL